MQEVGSMHRLKVIKPRSASSTIWPGSHEKVTVLKKKKKKWYQAARLLVKPQSVAVIDSAYART